MINNQFVPVLEKQSMNRLKYEPDNQWCSKRFKYQTLNTCLGRIVKVTFFPLFS